MKSAHRAQAGRKDERQMAERRSCPTRMVRIKTRKAAMTRAAHLTAANGVPVSWFRCGQCRDWHLTRLARGE